MQKEDMILSRVFESNPHFRNTKSQKKYIFCCWFYARFFPRVDFAHVKIRVSAAFVWKLSRNLSSSRHFYFYQISKRNILICVSQSSFFYGCYFILAKRPIQIHGTNHNYHVWGMMKTVEKFMIFLIRNNIVFVCVQTISL